MNVPIINTTLYVILFASAGIFFLAAIILSNKNKVLLHKDMAKSYRAPVPPRTMLNEFGKKIHTVLCVSGASAIISVFILSVIELIST